MQVRALGCKLCGCMHRQHALAPATINDGKRPIVTSYARAHCVLVSPERTCWDLDDVLGVASELRPDENLRQLPF